LYAQIPRKIGDFISASMISKYHDGWFSETYKIFVKNGVKIGVFG
jgi:phenolic acid decarboxylase